MAFASAGKTSSYYPLRAKLDLLETSVGSEKCGKSRCEVCLDIKNLAHLGELQQNKVSR